MGLIHIQQKLQRQPLQLFITYVHARLTELDHFGVFLAPIVDGETISITDVTIGRTC